jgi:hypothetical protein
MNGDPPFPGGEFVYVPVRHGCVFQAYYLDGHAGAVRG